MTLLSCTRPDCANHWVCQACGERRGAPPWMLQKWWSPGMEGKNGCCCWEHAPPPVAARWPKTAGPRP